MRISGLELVLCCVLILGFAACRGQAATVGSGDLALTLDDAGQVTALTVSGTNVVGGAEAAPLVTLCDVTKGQEFVAGAPAGGTVAEGLALNFEGLQATATVKCEPFREALQVTCDLKGAEGLPARGMLLRFAFPMDCEGWRWHDDMQTSREIGAGEVFENVRPLRAWADLPEWKDQPDLRMGYSNRNFATVLTGPVGLCLAAPLDRPCIFRTAYDDGAKQLQMVYDFALSPDTATPNAVSFSFLLYSSDPAWGFRAALQRYYDLFPQMFEVYAKEQGMWMAFSPLSQIDNANEFYFGLQEGAREPAYDDKIGVLDCTYFTHAGQFAWIPGYDGEKDPLPPHERLVEVMTETFKKHTGVADMYPRVGLHNSKEELDIRRARVYGDIIAQFNLDPDLPYGKWYLDRTAKQTQSFLDRNGGVLDGFYYDGLTSGINYRKEHFKTSVAPPLWDPVAKKPLLNNFFSATEFAHAAAELLRPRGQITMMNGALGASFYVAPWLDILGSETGLRINREGLNYIRAVTHHKPFLTLLKGNYEQKIGRPQMELFMKRALAYGIFPGFFDWPPSGLGPGGRYWAHPEYYERDRDLFRKYEPLCKTLALAGWEPVTYARSSSGQVFVERFGPGEDGIVWLTLLNEEAQPHTTTLTLDAKGLGLDPTAIKCTDVLTNKAAAFKAKGNQLSAQIEVPADGVAMLQLSTPQQAAAWRLARALDTVERGITMREVDAKKPPIAVHWVPTKEGYTREATDDGFNLVFDGTDRGEQSACQWAMLFQPDPAPVKLRVRAAGENLEGEGALRIYCRYAWVTKSYSHYENVYLDLPKGTYDYQDFELDINSEQPLRAIYVCPQMAASVTGKLKIAAISLSDQFADDYVVDPAFEQWYEPVPEAMRERLAAESGEIREALTRAREAVRRDLSSPVTRDALLKVGGRCTKLRAWIVAQHAENGCRRALRDLETTEQQLGLATLTALAAPLPEVVGPARAAAGDEIAVKCITPTVAGLPVKTDISADEGVGVKPTARGALLTIPDDLAPGTKLVRNNRSRAVKAEVRATAPEGWKAEGARPLQVPAGAEKSLNLRVSPAKGAQAGPVEVFTAAIAGKDRAQTSTILLYIPKEANLLRNPGFEDEGTSWGLSGDEVSIDNEVFHNGKAALRIHNASGAAQSQVSQTVTLNQERPCPILVRVASRAENVSGARSRAYSLYVDIYYTDGTPLYGQTYDFETGTTDWQLGEKYLEPAKPIRNVNVYLLLRGRSGTVWFDDAVVIEDPRRKGNIAREAKVTVDSAYSGYDAKPVNDGIVYPAEDAHWTEKAWASADERADHFIELRFAEPREVAKVAIYWSLDAGIPRWRWRRRPSRRR